LGSGKAIAFFLIKLQFPPDEVLVTMKTVRKDGR
jgi:hypothetical protein